MRSKWDIREILQKNAVTVMFVVLCIIGLICSGQTVSYVMYELFGRLSRNAFIVLALIIPIVAGMGINFAITIGAMAAQIAALWVIEWGISGLPGFLVAMLMTMPIAAFFGFLIGKLMNKMKGQEMIGGLILGYFANGLYQLLFLFIFGNLIPLKAPGLVIKGSTGVANTIDLSTDRGFKYALDGLLRVSFSTAVLIICGIIAVGTLVLFARKKMEKKKAFTYGGICVAAIVVAQLPFVKNIFSMVTVPMVTFFVVGLLCIFNNALMKTKIGQQFRAVGQNRTVANASGINDGAACVVVMSEEKAKELGVEPLATWVAGALAGVEPEVMGLGPIAATKKVMAKTGLTVDDMDLIEANEAFAAQSVAVGQALHFDQAKLNVNGGAIALGHPVGASGARILVTLLYAMKHRGAHKGLATLCIGGGMGCATIVEM